MNSSEQNQSSQAVELSERMEDLKQVEELSAEELTSCVGGRRPANGWVRFRDAMLEIVTFGQAETDFDRD